MRYRRQNNDFKPIWRTFMWLGVVLLTLFLISFASATLYEYYDTGDDNYYNFYGVMELAGQTFTVGTVGPNSDFTVNNVFLKLYQGGGGAGLGKINVSIRGYNSVLGTPNSTTYAYNSSFNAVGITTDTGGAWYNISLVSLKGLSASGSYSIVISNPLGDDTNILYWRSDNTASSYAGGQFYYSTNNGAIWTNLDRDFMFRVYGGVGGAPPMSNWINTTLKLPVNGTSLSKTYTNFTVNTTAYGTLNLTNYTLYIWNSTGLFNSTFRTISGKSNLTNLYMNTFTLDTYKWNAKVCGRNLTGYSTCNMSSSNFTLEVGASINDQSYPVSAYETQTMQFKANVTVLGGINLFAVRLVYNGTSYLASKSNLGGGTYAISKTIDAPLLKNGQTQNQTFYWSFEYKNGAIGKQNSSEFSHRLNVLTLNKTTASIPNDFVNFTVRNETSQARINSIMDASLRFWLGSGRVYKNFSLDSSVATASYSFSSNQNSTLNVSAIINVKATNFHERTFYFNKERWSNASRNVDLYLQDAGTSIILSVTDPGLVPVVGYYVNVYRYYPENNTYNIIEKGKTDEYGQVVVRLIEPNTIKYQFEFLDEYNNIEKRTGDMTIACRTTICVLPFVIEDTSDDFARFDNITDFEYSLSFSNTTNSFSYLWNDVTGNVIVTRLLVKKMSLNGTQIICNSTSISLSGSLSCDVGSSSASYSAQVYRRAAGEREILIATLNAKVGDTSGIYGLEGLFWSMILLLTLIGVGSYNPSVGVMLFLAGFVGLGILGVISFNAPVFFAILTIGVVFIWAFRA